MQLPKPFELVNQKWNETQPISVFVIPKTRAQIDDLVYSNGRNKPATIVFHQDGGHGWLQVPHTLVKQLNLESKISCFSFRDREFAYLEEDCDMSLFFQAMEFSNDKNLAQEFWNAIVNNYNENCPVRRMQRYKEREG